MIFRLKNELEIIKLQNEELVRKNGELKKLVFEQNNCINLEACEFVGSTLSNMFSPQKIEMILHKKKRKLENENQKIWNSLLH